MKKITLVILSLCFILLLISCEEEDTGIALDDYASRYQTILSEYETFLSEELNFTYFTMINVRRYHWDYSNIKLTQDYQDVMALLETLSYELSLLGPELTDESLMTHHSDLEYAIEALNNVYKDFTTQYNLNAKKPSQYGLYSEVFNLCEALTEPIEDYNDSTLNIESYLSSQEVLLDNEYLSTKEANMSRFNYVYTVLASQVAGYSEHTGMMVSPARTEFVREKEKFYRISELNSNIMIKVSDFLSKQSGVIAGTNISEPTKSKQLQYYADFINNFEGYTSIRTTLPADFFTSYDFMDYQKIAKRDFDLRYYYMMEFSWWPDLSDVHFAFDDIYFDEYHFDELDEYYMNIQTLILSEDHQINMNYEHITLEPIPELEEYLKRLSGE